MERRRGQIRRNHVLGAGHEPQRQSNPFAGCRVAPLVELLSPRTPSLASSLSSLLRVWGSLYYNCGVQTIVPTRPPPTTPSSIPRRGPAGSQSQSSRHFSRHPHRASTPHHTPPQHNMSEQLQVSIALPSIVLPHYGVVHSYKSCPCTPPAPQTQPFLLDSILAFTSSIRAL
jgi:hypothetical protein